LVVGAAGVEVAELLVGEVGAVGAIVAAGVTGPEVPEGAVGVVGVVCSTGTTPVPPVSVDSPACWALQAKLVMMLTNAVAETPSAAIRERCAGCGLRGMASHRHHRRRHHRRRPHHRLHHLMDLDFHR
jgi:hypothetical protein